jgi:hypothetical protein
LLPFIEARSRNIQRMIAMERSPHWNQTDGAVFYPRIGFKRVTRRQGRIV